MKRRKRLVRRKPLQASTPLEPTGFLRSKPLGRNRRKHYGLRPIQGDPDYEAQAAWKQWARTVGCQVCPHRGGVCDGDVEGHHVVPQRVLKRHVRNLVFTGQLEEADAMLYLRRLLWDTRNCMLACYRAHRRHENRHQPIDYHLLPPAALQFAEELHMLGVLRQHYPEAA